MDVTLRQAQAADELLLHRLFQFYLYEIAIETKQTTQLRVGKDGLFYYDKAIIDDYFIKPQHYPYFIEVNNEVAGFSLIRHYPDNPDLLDMGQFFVLGHFAGQQIGQQAFLQSLKRHSGSWQVRVLPNNQRAIAFWQNCIQQFTQNNYREFDGDYKSFKMKFFQFNYTSSPSTL